MWGPPTPCSLVVVCKETCLVSPLMLTSCSHVPCFFIYKARWLESMHLKLLTAVRFCYLKVHLQALIQCTPDTLKFMLFRNLVSPNSPHKKTVIWLEWCYFIANWRFKQTICFKPYFSFSESERFHPSLNIRAECSYHCLAEFFS